MTYEEMEKEIEDCKRRIKHLRDFADKLESTDDPFEIAKIINSENPFD